MRFITVVFSLCLVYGCGGGETEKTVKPPIEKSTSNTTHPAPKQDETRFIICSIVSRTTYKDCTIYELDCDSEKELAVFCTTRPGIFIPEEIPEPYRK